MISYDGYINAQNRAVEMIRQAGIVIHESEIKGMDVADFGLDDLYREGAQMVSLFNTSRISAKIIALFPGQTLPEHWHDQVEDDPGKEEVIRIACGNVYIYIPGGIDNHTSRIPKGKAEYYSSRQEIPLGPGDQLILVPGTKHWFQAGSEGAVIYSFSTCARDDLDKFSDPNIRRKTVIDQ